LRRHGAQSGLVAAFTLACGAGLIYRTQAAEQPKDEQRNKTAIAMFTVQADRPPKVANQPEYVIVLGLLDTSDQSKDGLPLPQVTYFPKVTVAEGQLAPIGISDGPENLLAKVVEDEKIKIGTFFDVRVKRLRGNKVRLFLSFQRNKPEKVNVSEILVLGNSVQTIQDVELHKPAKIVFQKDTKGSAQRWVQIAVDEQPSPSAPAPAR
jgi:hypothetical protein